MWIEGWTDMIKVIGAFCRYANMPKNYIQEHIMGECNG
jgi:hypothetical protein